MADLAESKAKVAFEIESRIKLTVKTLREGWVDLAENLYRFHDLQMWRDLGYESFDEWVAGPEIDLDRRWVYQLVAHWRELVVKLEAAPADLRRLEPSKLQEVLPAVRRGLVPLKQALADAEALPRNDLRERYSLQALEGGKEFSSQYDPSTQSQWARCHACGSRYRIEEE